MLKKMVEDFLGLLYPKRCPICEKIVIPKDKRICEECYENLKLIHEPRCKKCSKPISNAETEYCYDCQKREFHYEKGYALWVYDSAMRKSIAAFKYKNRVENGAFYVEELLKYYYDKIIKLNVDGIIPIPIHKSKRRQRGYNQASIIAQGIADAIHIPLYDDVLLRVVNTLPQKELNNRQRFYNLKHAFAAAHIAEYHLEGKSILLVDDIYTTGSTIEACSIILKQAGVKNVYFISLCIGKGY
ncbi:competence protein F homolog, phosphoribosyltransferase domain [Lachnospiraceae bacterium KM106-2]|nr:competence protein F homolog, phosphoribosyltransferase domain [Lachnospiraceae bacterium KM106-2]